MASVACPRAVWQPTNAAPLVRLFAYTQTLGLEAWLHRPKRGLATLVLSLVWLTLAWRGTGRPHRLSLLDEPLLLVRDGAGTLRCLSNVCTHRGKILVEKPCEANGIRCGYHGRRFALDAGRPSGDTRR